MAEEGNRFSGRMKRYAQVGSGVGGMALKYAGKRVFGGVDDEQADAAELRAALGGLKGPLMKVAQILATVPDLLPQSYTDELLTLQSAAPAMGWPFVRRRMRAELGADWQTRFASFEHEAAAAASLGQVHRAEAEDGRALACKLQYPDMDSAVEADLNQLSVILALHRRMDKAIDTSEVALEIGDRLREELDYEREAKHMRRYSEVLAPLSEIHVPEVLPGLSTRRLLTMTWLEGRSVLTFREAPLEVRNQIASNIFRAWWYPLSQIGVIHGDPHLGNYTVREDDYHLNLLDFGCVRIFPAEFVGGVIDLYKALERNDRAGQVAAYERWGFRDMSNALIDALNIWAGFIYGPLLDDRVRSVADGVKPSEYGRAQAFEVHSRLNALGPVKPPREFVFMDRAAVGLGAVFLHLGCELNFYRLFNEAIDSFACDRAGADQAAALRRCGLHDVHA